MPKLKHIVIVAGEESGDMHAAHMVAELLKINKNISLSGIGGMHMQHAGVELIMNLAQYGVTGLSEVLKQIFVIKKAFASIKNHLKKLKPDLLILIDYPGFNLRLAKFAKQELGLRIVYYISPQIWAWKANRMKTIQNTVDRMAVILPFEKKIYQDAGVPVSFVGHPLCHKIPENGDGDMQKARSLFNLPLDKKILAVLPGSRLNEIQKHMPVLVQTIEKLHQKFPNMHYVIPIARTLNPNTIRAYFHSNSTSNTRITIHFMQDEALNLITASDCVIVASGTASLECALSLKPMCIIYKASWFTYFVAMKLIKVKYLGLCNLLQNKMIVPELLQDDCNSEELCKTIENLLDNNGSAKQQIADLKNLKQSLSSTEADCSLADLIQSELMKS